MKKYLLLIASLLLMGSASATITEMAAIPGSGSLTVRFSDDQAQEINLTVYNFLGQPLFSSNFMTSVGQNSIRLDNLSLYHGTYMVKILSRSGEVKLLRFNF